MKEQPEPKCKTCGHSDSEGNKKAADCFDCTGHSDYLPDCNQPEELEPCPHCGDLPIESEEEYNGYRKMYLISCHNCGSSMFGLTKADVRATWKTRHNTGKE